MTLRVSVVIGMIFLAGLGIAAVPGEWTSHAASGTGPGRRLRVALVAALLVAVGIALECRARTAWVSVALDWLPGAYLLAAYWLPAMLPRRRAPRLERWLGNVDRRVFEAGFGHFVNRVPRALLEYLEAAYLCCYAVVPAGLVWLYLAHERAAADRFWTAVLLAALPSYALVVLFETRPPRNVDGQAWVRSRNVALRRVNLAVLERASIGVNTFPSAHAAASLAAALSVGAVRPAAGAALGVVALSIAVGSVAGRYHYSLDAAFGALLAIVAFALSRLV